MKPDPACWASSSAHATAAWKRAAQGFTLIELMITVAIVGILAAIALPQYQIYTGRAQLTEALHLTEGRKTAIAERLQFGAPLATINGGSDGIPDDIPASSGKYVDSLIIASGTIVATMRSTNISPCALGSVVTIAPLPITDPAAPISWTCSTTASCKPLTCS